MYPHKLIFLNPNHIQPDTPLEIRDWLQFIHQSINNPSNPDINLSKAGIKKAASLADKNKMKGMILEDGKIEEMRKEAKVIYEKNAREEGVEEGEIRKEVKMILKLRGKGKSQEEISDLLDIPIERVAQAIESHRNK